MVQNRTAHKHSGLLIWVIELVFIGAAHHELWGWRIPNRGVFAWFSKPRGVFFANVPTRFVGKPIMRSREYRATFVPDDLLMVQKANSQQAIENLAGELRCMPHVRHL